jgi:hypothetical protein
MSDDKPPPTVVVQPQGVVAVATDAIGALRGTPVLLVMVLLNCAFLFAAAYYLRGQQHNAFTLVDKILDRCLLERPDRHQSDVYPPSSLGSLQ